MIGVSVRSFVCQGGKGTHLGEVVNGLGHVLPEDLDLLLATELLNLALGAGGDALVLLVEVLQGGGNEVSR